MDIYSNFFVSDYYDQLEYKKAFAKEFGKFKAEMFYFDDVELVNGANSKTVLNSYPFLRGATRNELIQFCLK